MNTCVGAVGRWRRSRWAIRSAPVLLLLALVTGCPPGDEVPRDSGEATGLSIEWESRPESFPGETSFNVTIDRARFRLESLRVVGDAGPLAIPEVTLAWASGISPPELKLDDAPSGLYSRLLFDVAAGSTDYAYEIAGTIDIDNTTRSFVVRDRASLSLSLDYSLVLSPGNEVSLPVRVEIDKLLEAIDFDVVPVQNGGYLIEDGDPQLVDVRTELAGAFSVQL